MPVNPTVTRQHRPFRYGEVLAVSLLRYAQQDAQFAQTLSGMVERLWGFRALENLPEISAPTQILAPPDADAALRRAEWLVGRIADGNLPGAQCAAAMLASGVRSDALSSPRYLVVGVITVAIPGITLGRFSKKVTMPVVVRRDIHAQQHSRVAPFAVQATAGVLKRALELADGTARKLEPEIGDWLFGDQRTTFYAADGKKIDEIERGLRELDIPSAAVADASGTAVLAISPAVNGHYQAAFWQLESVEA